MNNTISSLIGGIAGAIALNVVHQLVKQFDRDAPHVDLIGEEALSKGMERLDIEPPKDVALFTATLVADLISNAAYYSLIGLAEQKHLMLLGAGSGLAAGIGTLTLTELLGLKDAPVNRTEKTKLMTVAWYTIGGLVAAAVISGLRKNT